MKHLLSVVAIAALSASTLVAADSKSQQAASKNKPVAVINGETITVGQLDALYARLSPEMRKNYEDAGGKVNYLEQYISKRLLVQQATRENFDKRADVAFELQAARDTALFDRYVRDIVASEIVTEARIKSYYQAHLEDYKRPAAVHIRHIVISPISGPVLNTSNSDASTKEEAKALIGTIARQLDGTVEKFADLAIKFSEDSSAKSGGDLGWFPRGAMAPVIEETAFKMKVGQTSGIIESEYGYHIVRLEEKRDGGFAPFEDVRGEIREKMMLEEKAKIIAAINKLTFDIRQSSKVSVFRENL